MCSGPGAECDGSHNIPHALIVVKLSYALMRAHHLHPRKEDELRLVKAKHKVETSHFDCMGINSWIFRMARGSPALLAVVLLRHLLLINGKVHELVDLTIVAKSYEAELDWKTKIKVFLLDLWCNVLCDRQNLPFGRCNPRAHRARAVEAEL